MTAPLQSSLIAAGPASLFDVRVVTRANKLFAILDACDAPHVLSKVAELGEAHAVSLYRGGAEEQLADIAPYLVTVNEDTFDWLLTTLWGEPWGVFVISDSPLATLRTHFRKFLVVTSPIGEQLYFRFYDPRVLPAYAATCNAGELKDFFGTVSAYGTADEANGVQWHRIATPQEAWALEHPARSIPKITFRPSPSTPPRPDPET